MLFFVSSRLAETCGACQLHQAASIEVAQLEQFVFCFLLVFFLLFYIQSWNGSGPAASTSHGVRHPVDHVHHGESEREHSPGVDVDGVGIDGLAHALGAALPLLLLLGLLRLPGPSPPGLHLLTAAALSWDLAAGALGPPVAV